MLRPLRKGQSTAEYAIVIGLVIAAAVAMQIYVKRGLQAKMKDAVDYNDPASKKVDGSAMFSGVPFEPKYTTSEMTSTSATHGKDVTDYGGGVTRTILTGNADKGDLSTRTGTQITLNPAETAAP